MPLGHGSGPDAASPTHPVFPLSAFGHDIWWLIILKTVVVFVFLMVMTLFMIWAERRVVARMQQRLGPNRVGPFGSAAGARRRHQAGAEGRPHPRAADKLVFILAPIISAIPAFMAFAVIPFGPTVSIFGHHTTLQLTDLPVAVLFVLAMSSMGVYGIVLAGWSSGSTYPLLGGAAFGGPDDQLRSRDGPVVRRRLPPLRIAVDLRDRRLAAPRAGSR